MSTKPTPAFDAAGLQDRIAARKAAMRTPSTTTPAATPAKIDTSRRNQISYAEYTSLTPTDKSAFFKRGGKLADVPALLKRAEAPEVVPEKPVKTMSYTEFRKMSQSEKARWCLSGGRINE